MQYFILKGKMMTFEVRKDDVYCVRRGRERGREDIIEGSFMGRVCASLRKDVQTKPIIFFKMKMASSTHLSIANESFGRRRRSTLHGR